MTDPRPAPDSGSPSGPLRLVCNGVLVRFYRQQRGWTQPQLATRAGYSERLVRKVEKGEPIRRSSIEHLAQALSTEELPLYWADLTTDPLAVAQAFVRAYLRHGRNAAEACSHLCHPDVVMAIHTDAPNLAFG